MNVPSNINTHIGCTVMQMLHLLLTYTSCRQRRQAEGWAFFAMEKHYDNET